MSYYVYVLRSDKFERNYIGFSSNVEKRLVDHNKGIKIEGITLVDKIMIIDA